MRFMITPLLIIFCSEKIVQTQRISMQEISSGTKWSLFLKLLVRPFQYSRKKFKIIGWTRRAHRFLQIPMEIKNVQFSEAFIKINIIFNEEDYFLFELLAGEGFHYNEIQNIKLNLNFPGKEFKSRNDKNSLLIAVAFIF